MYVTVPGNLQIYSTADTLPILKCPEKAHSSIKLPVHCFTDQGKSGFTMRTNGSPLKIQVRYPQDLPICIFPTLLCRKIQTEVPANKSSTIPKMREMKKGKWKIPPKRRALWKLVKRLQIYRWSARKEKTMIKEMAKGPWQTKVMKLILRGKVWRQAEKMSIGMKISKVAEKGCKSLFISIPFNGFLKFTKAKFRLWSL